MKNPGFQVVFCRQALLCTEVNTDTDVYVSCCRWGGPGHGEETTGHSSEVIHSHLKPVNQNVTTSVGDSQGHSHGFGGPGIGVVLWSLPAPVATGISGT